MNDDRVRQIYAELGRFEIELAPDPISLGPKYLQEIIATCRNYMNAVTKVLMEVNLEKQMLTRELNALQAAYDLEADSLLATDDRVRKQPNIRDRESTVKVLLRDQIRLITAKKAEVNDLACVEKAVKHKHGELKETMDAIKMQKSLIQAEISTGAMYGDERHPTRSPSLTPPDMMDDDEVLALLGDEKPSPPVPIKVEQAPAQAEDTPARSVPAQQESQDSPIHDPSFADLMASVDVPDELVSRFLQAESAGPITTPDDDFSSILENI